ncbi:MAG: protein kinase domain-containing protein [Thermoanaerobaculia bacterium]
MNALWEVLFDELVDLDAAARADRLEAIAAEDAGLASLLERLLAADDGETELLGGSLADKAPEFVAAAMSAPVAASPPAGRDRTGERIGSYRLLSLLGRGGMGEVWLAERADGEFDQRVAVKLVRSEVGSEAILARFLRERRILARLEHPGIARLLDGGRSGSGEPYFVLEYVDGTPVTDWCGSRPIPVEAVIRLFAEVCEAVDHAHRSLVVHRDLKPSNVLVDKEGRPKLLDFGIAKLMTPEPASAEAEATGETRLETLALTPAYAAPEQILGEPVTTATDVYALGVLLYELLTGEKPYARAARPLPALAREVETETFERPSERLRRRPGASPAEARRRAARLDGDLDTIVAKALQRDPQRRYPGAAALAEDLRRSLDGRPVRARPDSVAYRTGRFLFRHRLAVTAASLVVLSLVAGLAVALWQARVARAEARRAERVKGFLVDIFREADPSRTRGATITAGEILETGGKRVERELAAEPEVAAELLDAIAQVENNLGLLDAAQKRASASLALRRGIYGPGAAATAASHLTLAEVTYEQNTAGSRREFEAASKALAAAGADTGETGDRLGDLRISLLWREGKLEPALAEAKRQLKIAERRDGPRSLRAARCRIALTGLLADSSRLQEAQAQAIPALDAIRQAPGADPIEIGRATFMVAELIAMTGDKQEAARMMEEGLALLRRSLGPRHLGVGLFEIKYAFNLFERRQYDEADRLLLDARSILAPIGHPETGTALRYLGLTAMARDRLAEAARYFEESEALFTRALGADHMLAVSVRQNRGEVLLRLGRLAEAEDLLRAAAHDVERLEGPQGNSLRNVFKFLGEVRRRRGDVDEALALHHRGREIALAIFGTTEHLGVAAADLQIALDHLARPTPAGLVEAGKLADEGIAIVRKLDPEHPRLAELIAAREKIAVLTGRS